MEKIYCGSGKEKTFENGGSIISLSVCLDEYPKEYLTDFNGKRYLKLDVCRKREIDQYGKSHYVAVNTWQPEQVQQQNNNTATRKESPSQGNQQSNQQSQFEDDIPF
jgi:hypothetical protein